MCTCCFRKKSTRVSFLKQNVGALLVTMPGQGTHQVCTEVGNVDELSSGVGNYDI